MARLESRREGYRIHRPGNMAQGTYAEMENHRGPGRCNAGPGGRQNLRIWRQGDEEVTLCLNAADGQGSLAKQASNHKSDRRAWPDTQAPRCSPAVADGKVVTLGVGGILSCLDAATSKEFVEQGRVPQNRGPSFIRLSSPIIVDGLCIAQTRRKRQRCVSWPLT